MISRLVHLWRKRATTSPRRFAFRVTTSEACGPSGAGSLPGDRTARLNPDIRLTVPKLGNAGGDWGRP